MTHPPGPPPPTTLLPRLRSVDPREVARLLASLVGMPPDRLRLAQRLAWYPAEPPDVVPEVDVDAWLSWCLAGLPTFAMHPPTLQRVRDTAARVLLLLLAAKSGGNVSETSRVLVSSRRAIREQLKRLHLYPLRTVAENLRAGARDRPRPATPTANLEGPTARPTYEPTTLGERTP